MLKLTTKIPGIKAQAFIVNFKHISNFFLVLVLKILNRQMFEKRGLETKG